MRRLMVWLFVQTFARATEALERFFVEVEAELKRRKDATNKRG